MGNIIIKLNELNDQNDGYILVQQITNNSTFNNINETTDVLVYLNNLQKTWPNTISIYLNTHQNYFLMTSQISGG